MFKVGQEVYLKYDILIKRYSYSEDFSMLINWINNNKNKPLEITGIAGTLYFIKNWCFKEKELTDLPIKVKLIIEEILDEKK
jgi:hypothetical protein